MFSGIALILIYLFVELPDPVSKAILAMGILSILFDSGIHININKNDKEE